MTATVIFEILGIPLHSEVVTGIIGEKESMTGVDDQHRHHPGGGALHRRLESQGTTANFLQGRLSSFVGGETQETDLRLPALLRPIIPRVVDYPLAMETQAHVGAEETIGRLVPVGEGLHRRQMIGREPLTSQVVRKRGDGGRTLIEIENTGDGKTGLR